MHTWRPRNRSAAPADGSAVDRVKRSLSLRRRKDLIPPPSKLHSRMGLRTVRTWPSLRTEKGLSLPADPAANRALTVEAASTGMSMKALLRPFSLKTSTGKRFPSHSKTRPSELSENP